MASLASIPEAISSLANTRDIKPLHRRTASFERIRPRSRVLVLSRRPTRVRNPARPPQVPTRLPQTHGRGHAPAQNRNGLDVQPRRGRNSPREENKTQMHPGAPATHQTDTASSADRTFETSLSSVDLDSFPLPPSSNMPLRWSRTASRPVPKISTNIETPHLHPGPSAQGRAMSPRDKGMPTTRRRCFGDAVADVARASKHASVDSALVEAISKTVIQQLRLFSAIKQGDRVFSKTPRSNASPTYAHDNQSRSSSSRREALDRFTKDLHRYVENTGVRGKTVHSTPTLTKSGETLHTVSALMPFRPEFRAAGLAVTSKDQAQRLPGHPTNGRTARLSRRRPPPVTIRRYLHPSQVDGHPGRFPSNSINTEISFAPSQDMDEWRYALMEEAPVRKKRVPKHKKSKKHCLPCFPGDDEQTTDAEWAHFKQAPGNTAPRQRALAGPSSRMPPPTRLPPPRPVERPSCGSDDPSPRDTSGGPGRRGKRKEIAAKSALGPRRYSATLPKANAHVEACHGSGPQARSKNTTRKRSQYPDDRSARLQSDQARLARDAKKFERELLSPGPYGALPGREISQGMEKTQGSTAPEADSDSVSSALPSTWERQGGPVSNLEEELEKTARLVAETKPPTASKRTAQSSRRHKRPVSRYDPNHVRICCRSSRGIPSRADAAPNIPKRTSSIRGSINSYEVDFDDGEIADRDVLRGLHVAASAACDEEVDAFVRNRTGLRIRRFLADLMALEAFGDARPGEGGEQRARRRRAEMRKLKQQVRRSREIAMTGGLT
ncbi:Uncharacterized protein TCAP_03181 [Tolypocladium capitatum]|uniref:Uncharacterized protein n=1 Tax=Tolypocladium capitatum TaxID=45235 RepID=A0A2K3QH82_9HYPO|nr:Uncharacterized protein TCAP_03181 [Tolypocladium capitatum]